MKLDFLPEDYETLKSEGKYWKLSQFKEGDTKFRIVQRPIGGWVDWLDKKPYRYRPKDKPSKSFDPAKPMKSFWACYVWDYTREDMFILDITQSGVLKALESFASDEDWGDFTNYDLKIKREGSGMETKYHVTPLPHKPLPEKAKISIKSSPVRLEALYDSGDPWRDLDPTLVDVKSGELLGKSEQLSAKPVQLNDKSVHLSDDVMISDEQTAELDLLLQNLKDPDALKKLCEHVGVLSIYAINPKDFDRVVRSIRKKIKEKGDAQ